jgi:hypothetical protein
LIELGSRAANSEELLLIARFRALNRIGGVTFHGGELRRVAAG